MEDPLYREIILEHWQNPQNYGVVEGATFDVEGANPLCGDQIRLTGKIVDGVLTEIAFTGEGCAVSKASASVYTERIKGVSVDGIRKIGGDKVLAALGVELTPARAKCALLVHSAMRGKVVV
jgi:nitrogen fixation NifU-like protein